MSVKCFASEQTEQSPSGLKALTYDAIKRRRRRCLLYHAQVFKNDPLIQFPGIALRQITVVIVNYHSVLSWTLIYGLSAAVAKSGLSPRQ